MMIMIRGVSMGSVSRRNVYSGVALSTFAASKTSRGRLFRPASSTNVENGSHCQIVMPQIVNSAM